MPAKTKQEAVIAVLDWRRRAKNRLIAAFGGACGLCGYNRCARNLVFHHLDPSIKGDGFGQFQSRAWIRIVDEVRKCVMLCHNCHGEVHAGLHSDLSSCQRFNEAFLDYDRSKDPTTHRTTGLSPRPSPKATPLCVQCGRSVTHQNMIVCSSRCREIRARNARAGHSVRKKPSAAMLARLLKTKSCEALAPDFSVTGKTMRLWAHGYGIDVRAYNRNGGLGGIRTHAGLASV